MGKRGTSIFFQDLRKLMQLFVPAGLRTLLTNNKGISDVVRMRLIKGKVRLIKGCYEDSGSGSKKKISDYRHCSVLLVRE